MAQRASFMLLGLRFRQRSFSRRAGNDRYFGGFAFGVCPSFDRNRRLGFGIIVYRHVCLGSPHLRVYRKIAGHTGLRGYRLG